MAFNVSCVSFCVRVCAQRDMRAVVTRWCCFDFRQFARTFFNGFLMKKDMVFGWGWQPLSGIEWDEHENDRYFCRSFVMRWMLHVAHSIVLFFCLLKCIDVAGRSFFCLYFVYSVVLGNINWSVHFLSIIFSYRRYDRYPLNGNIQNRMHSFVFFFSYFEYMIFMKTFESMWESVKIEKPDNFSFNFNGCGQFMFFN